MKRVASGLVLLVAILTPAKPGYGQQVSLLPEWEIRAKLEELVKKNQQLKTMLEQIDSSRWQEHGAPQAFVDQLKRVMELIGALESSLQALHQKPDKISIALDAIFRIQTVRLMLSSLAGGIREYQNPQLASLIESLISENSAYEQLLQQYTRDLAAVKEKELEVMHQEAQRCREQLLRQGPSRE